MFTRGKIFTAYEKIEAAEPTDRVELVAEGFSGWAFIFNIVWLLSNRLWLASVVYFITLIAIFKVGVQFGLPDITVILLQVFVQLILAYSAYDLRRAKLAQHGYRFAGIIVAESQTMAERRYYDHAA